jgi:hypothetical protein
MKKKIKILLTKALILVSKLIKKDSIYLKIMYRIRMNKKLNLSNPITFNEKMQWYKIYDRKKVYNEMVDKINAKKYVENLIGKKCIIPTIGIYNDFSEIDFDKLPNSFVIKCSHDCGSVYVKKPNDSLDINRMKKKINKAMKNNYYYKWREWQYLDLKPRILIEKYMGDNLYDYKIQCFNGIPDNIFVCEGRMSDRGVRYHYFDTEWNYLDYCPYSDVTKDNVGIEKPKKLNEMLEISKKLSSGFPQLRVDLYLIDDEIYFGELTLYTNSGFDDTITEEADRILGNKLDLITGNNNEV